MGFIKAFAGAIGGTFADQWKDFIVPMSGVPATSGIYPAVPQGMNADRGANSKNSNNIISFEALRRKKPNKKVFNINDDTINFEDLQRLSNYVVDLKDESTLIAMNN